MSNEINTRKFYQFLANYEKGEQSWTNVADGEYGNADGTVTKAEFRNFLNGEWDGEQNGQLNNDLINTFWKKIDTNTSASKIKGTKLRNLNALDKDETANLDKKLEAYVQLNEFVANNVKIPNVLATTGSQWKWDVVDDLTALVEEFAQSNDAGDIKQMLAEKYPAIANKNTATYCAVEYQSTLKSTILAEYPDYKVADDNTLNSLLTAYVATIDGDANPEDIKAEVLEIVDAYLATAGLGDDSGYDLSTLGYKQDNGSALNDIQKAVLTQTIKNNLSGIKNEADYDKYQEIFDNAIQTFVENKLATAKYGDFENLKTVGLEEFKATKEYATIQNRIAIDKNFKNIEQGSDFYNALVAAFGEDLAKTIMNDGRYIKNSAGENVYMAILDKVHEKVANGEFMVDGKLDLNAIQEFIINEIQKSLNDFFPNGLGDMSIESLNMLYDKRAEAASKEEDDDASLKQHRQAAIDYCNALAKKGTSLANAVKEIFGNDYTSEINKMYPSEILSKMEELKARALEIGEISDMSDAEKAAIFNGVKDSYTLSLAETCSFNLPNSIGCGVATITSDRISYKSSGCITIDASGKATIDTSKPGVYNATITVLVDGKTLHSKTVLVTIRDQVTPATLVNGVKDWAGTNPDGVTVMYKANGNDAGESLTSSTFTDLYNNDAIICVGAFRDNDYYNWGSNGEEVVKERLTSLGAFIVDTLASSNSSIDKATLSKAMNNVVNKYAVNPTGDYYKTKRRGDTAANFYNYMKDNKNKVKNGLVQVKDPDGDDSNVYGLYFKEFVDAIIAEYNRLKG